MSATAPRQTFKQICTCENCGNEAEMIVTCSLAPDEKVSTTPAAQSVPQTADKPARKQRPGQATCTHCGNEAEILVDIL